ncbi:MAG: hypothetical protein J6D54_08325 [Olsenella sp.]|nr:hypothetical protein [Olsenella sp.]
MATDEAGNMRECRLDCAWIIREPGTATCAVANIAVTQRTTLREFDLNIPSTLLVPATKE